ncbi:MAG: dual specificity protein phosphatase family protein [Polyangiaceae bacterium]|nr:dual specificity protein phosphatase family protein [Polyangiaceae bacterium]
MWRIGPRLYLGDYDAGAAALAGAARLVEPESVARPFAGVISLCPVPLFDDDPRVHAPQDPFTEWLEVPIEDGGAGETEFELMLEVALPFATRQLARGNLLVHCAAGMSRSVSTIAAVLCERGARPEEAFAQIARRKAAALGAPPELAQDLIAPAAEFRAVLARRYGR